jgi:hypothetical protein
VLGEASDVLIARDAGVPLGLVDEMGGGMRQTQKISRAFYELFSASVNSGSRATGLEHCLSIC